VDGGEYPIDGGVTDREIRATDHRVDGEDL
jgi:hypothetical protein